MNAERKEKLIKGLRIAAVVTVAISPLIMIFVSLFVGNYPLAVKEVFDILFEPASATLTRRIVVC